MKTLVPNPELRNIAIIAHVDHGKTTLVDALFKQSGTFRENQDVAERVMDRGELEKERGITISAKNCSITWKGTKINIIDTPGHADFGGEVERALSMVNGVILLVDASEGPLPQTRFVLKKALEKGLKVIVVVNKIDRQDARRRPSSTRSTTCSLTSMPGRIRSIFPSIMPLAARGLPKRPSKKKGRTSHPLFDASSTTSPSPLYDPEAPFQMMVQRPRLQRLPGPTCVGRVGQRFCQDRRPAGAAGRRRQAREPEGHQASGLFRRRLCRNS